MQLSCIECHLFLIEQGSFSRAYYVWSNNYNLYKSHTFSFNNNILMRTLDHFSCGIHISLSLS